MAKDESVVAWLYPCKTRERSCHREKCCMEENKRFFFFKEGEERGFMMQNEVTGGSSSETGGVSQCAVWFRRGRWAEPLLWEMSFHLTRNKQGGTVLFWLEGWGLLSQRKCKAYLVVWVLYIQSQLGPSTLTSAKWSYSYILQPFSWR